MGHLAFSQKSTVFLTQETDGKWCNLGRWCGYIIANRNGLQTRQ